MSHKEKSDKKKLTLPCKESNKEIAKVLDKNFAKILEKLESIAGELGAELDAIWKRFVTIDEPLKESARMIGMTFENFDKRTHSMAKELRYEFTRQNEDNIDKLEVLCTRLEDYSKQLRLANEIQSKRTDLLNTNVTSLSDAVLAMHDALIIIERLLQPKAFKKLDDRVLEITQKSSLEFSREYQSINHNLTELFRNLTIIFPKMSENIQIQSEIFQVVNKNLTELTTNVYTMSSTYDLLEKTMQKILEVEEAKAEQAKKQNDLASKIDSLSGHLQEGFKTLEKQNKSILKELKTISQGLNKGKEKNPGNE